VKALLTVLKCTSAAYRLTIVKLRAEGAELRPAALAAVAVTL
jgi:hypothetical protein